MNLNTKNIGKTFSGVNVLRNVNFSLEPGEVHALVGENGAGKSTFVKVLSWVYTPTIGNISLDDQKVQINTPIAAQKKWNFVNPSRATIFFPFISCRKYFHGTHGWK